ncbi:alpha-hydroxy-acid oxidizing enzyme [Advenella sp. S44]|uniref:alpha-hydroxy acid oxidase n=1 Tax=Advenella sp. S44 TaxID=1982755 RepID=UPI000C2B0C4B|nr:alpha-hydroxy acid oxidase [Advenella sp. S44]PJX26550.1 alpha-hydroxy-acid oxidizing enzyme [Advenella sp. S44]
MARIDQALCLDDFEAMAQRHLPRPIFEYIRGGVETNASVDDNRRAFQDYAFIPRALVDVSSIDTSVSLLGKQYRSPVGIAPMGLSALSSYRGDLVLAQAGGQAGIPVIMSGSSLIRLEEVATSSPGTWFQAYLPGDVQEISKLVDRVAQAGFTTLVITVDTPVAANRENNIRAGFTTPLRPSARLLLDGLTHPRWVCNTFLRTCVRHGMPHFENNYATRGAPILSRNVLRDYSDRGHISWNHLRAIRKQWKGALVIKGILRKADAVTAIETGADAIIVSNHGGRQLDGSISPLRVLPEIADIAGDIPVMLDSGIRRGTDVLKALALGARCVFVGRPFGYATATGGRKGADRAINLITSEITRDLGLLGVTRLQDLSADVIRKIHD